MKTLVQFFLLMVFFLGSTSVNAQEEPSCDDRAVSALVFSAVYTCNNTLGMLSLLKNAYSLGNLPFPEATINAECKTASKLDCEAQFSLILFSRNVFALENLRDQMSYWVSCYKFDQPGLSEAVQKILMTLDALKKFAQAGVVWIQGGKGEESSRLLEIEFKKAKESVDDLNTFLGN
jgi:hypothetical protein